MDELLNIPDEFPGWLIPPATALIFLGWAKTTKGAQVLRDGVAFAVGLFLKVSTARFKERLKSRRQISLVLDDLARASGAARATLICVHREKPPIDLTFADLDQVYCTVVESETITPVANAKKDWNSQFLNSAYARDIVQKVLANPHEVLFIFTADLDSKNPLKAFDGRDKIVLSLLRHVHTMPNAIYFVLCSFVSDYGFTPDLDPSAVEEINNGAAAIHQCGEELRPLVIKMGEFEEEESK